MPSIATKRSPLLISSLPEELVIEIIARVPRCNYPKLSRVSNHFRSLVASPHIYARRSLLGRTEHCVYLVLYDRNFDVDRLFTLHMNRLVQIPALPVMPRRGSYAVRGSMIYMFDNKTSNGFSIDCRSHTVQPLPSLSMPMSHSLIKFIEGEIHVIRACDRKTGLPHKVLVFDTKKGMWKPEMTKTGTELCDKWHRCEMYWTYNLMKNSKNKFVRPKYNYNDSANKLKAYDPKHKCWTVVKGVEDLLDHRYPSRSFSHTVYYGGKLAVLLFSSRGSSLYLSISCVEIALERSQEGEILGKVERHSHLFKDCSSFVELLRVIV